MVLVVERVTPGLRGQLTRWLVEVHAGVFVGHLSPRVREHVWRLVQSCRRKHGAAVLAYGTPSEQGFVMLSVGDSDRTVVDFDGLTLLRRPNEATSKDPDGRAKPRP